MTSSSPSIADTLTDLLVDLLDRLDESTDPAQVRASVEAALATPRDHTGRISAPQMSPGAKQLLSNVLAILIANMLISATGKTIDAIYPQEGVGVLEDACAGDPEEVIDPAYLEDFPEIDRTEVLMAMKESLKQVRST